VTLSASTHASVRLTDARICAALGDLVGLALVVDPDCTHTLSRMWSPDDDAVTLGLSGPTPCLGIPDSVVRGGDHLL
jgi:hypothetical protein